MFCVLRLFKTIIEPYLMCQSWTKLCGFSMGSTLTFVFTMYIICIYYVYYYERQVSQSCYTIECILLDHGCKS